MKEVSLIPRIEEETKYFLLQIGALSGLKLVI